MDDFGIFMLADFTSALGRCGVEELAKRSIVSQVKYVGSAWGVLCIILSASVF